MHTAYPRTRHFNMPVTLPSEMAWSITLLFAWLGLPFLRELLVWVLMRLYELFVMHGY